MSVFTGRGASAAAESALRMSGVQRPTLVRPPSRWGHLDLAELWANRSLLFFLVQRDVKVRYAQTVLGAGWAILQPVLTMVVFTVIFGQLARVPSDGMPYAVFSLTALVPWTYFSTSLSGASNSLIASANLLTKVYFPRLVIPAAPVLAALVDFAIAFLILLVMLFAYGIVPPLVSLALVPILIGVMLVTAVGVGCWLAALGLRYRDVRYAVPFLIQVWMYASPVVYPASLIPAEWRWAFALNPMVGVIEGFRWVLLGTNPPGLEVIGTSLLMAGLLLGGGIAYFQRVERHFADLA